MPAGDRNIHPHILNITVDPRIELLAVVQYLSGYGQRFPLLTNFDLGYKTEIETAFQPFRGHPAVELFDQMSSTFHADAPPAAMFHLSEPPMLAVQVPFSDYLAARAGGLDRLDRFIGTLRDFAQESAFMDFYLAHTAYYAALLEPLIAQFAQVDDVAILEQYFGMRQHSYSLILAPLFSNAGYGSRIPRGDGLWDLFSITGAAEIDAENRPTFGDGLSLHTLVWHEFAHSFVNPLVEEFLEEINLCQSLFQNVSERMTLYGYGNWEITVKEHIVRAVTVRLLAREMGEAHSLASLEQQRSWGFLYIRKITGQLIKYEEQRSRFSNFRSFFPELITAFAR